MQMDAEHTNRSPRKLSTHHDVSSFDDHRISTVWPVIKRSLKSELCSQVLVDLGHSDVNGTSTSDLEDTSFSGADEAKMASDCMTQVPNGNSDNDVSENLNHIIIENEQKIPDTDDDPSTCLIPKYPSTDSEESYEPGLFTRLLSTAYNVPYTVRQAHRVDKRNQNFSERAEPMMMAKCSSRSLLHWNWAAIRLGCFVILVFIIVSIFCVVIRLVTPGNRTNELRRGWWQGTVSYEIFPASFQDSDNDGYGDFKGLIQRLDYVQSLNVTSVRLNSIFSALDYPLEYSHIIDFLSVDPHLGRMEDFQELVEELHARDMRLILDINPSLTSDQHTWAAHWLQNSSGKFKYYYVNNEILANFSEFEEDEKENPSRPFGSQLFLNWSHPAVQKEIEDVLDFWLQKGVDGFYVKGLNNLRRDNQTDLYSVMRRWRYLLDIYSVDDNKKIMMISDIFVKKLKDEQSLTFRLIFDLCDLIDVQLHISLNHVSTVKTQFLDIAEWSNVSTSPWTNWHIGSVATSRLASRLDTDYTLGAMMFLLMLPGSISLFYGDEINLQDSIDITTGKTYSEGQLCPMQWEPTFEANFTSNESLPWLPIRPDYLVNNVAKRSVNITLLRHIISAKQRSPSLWMKAFYTHDSYTSGKQMSTFIFHYIDTNVIVFERHFSDYKKYVVFAGFGEAKRTHNFSSYFSNVKVLFSTYSNFNSFNLDKLSVYPGTVLVGEIVR
ncbi:neutral and basic amino acid transport protein rBAT-like [Limulus polyphemus]|uniref:Neutral and basic amino acid transport protein rBAT-like n=1 Tax=Limulus polyphemus TaxID=6850 RepID=A0ABM1T5K1_LIMPO|nr:neutral and basic amino acid transport protein rBAT-like [Limulus polyphemus]